MKCKDVTYQLSEYLDGRLSDEGKRDMETHLNNCASCREQYEDLKNYQSLVSSLAHKKAPADLEEKVFERIASGGASSMKAGVIVPLWLKTLAVAAIIIGFVYIILPGQYFRPVEIETSYVPQVQKKGKGPVEEKHSSKGADPRILFIEELTELHGGKIIEKKTDHTSGLTDVVIIEIPRRSYQQFAQEFNRPNTLVRISEKIPFSLRKKVVIHIYLSAKEYAVSDFNGDGFDDVMMHVLSGNNKGRTLIAINQRQGGFELSHDTIVSEKVKLISSSGNLFHADIDGDGRTEIVERINTGEFPHWIFYSDTSRSDGQVIVFEAHASGYFGEYMIFFGDFNGDGYDDILAKSGSSIIEGEWYISLNNQKNGFELGYGVYWGKNRLLVFNKDSDLLD